MASSSDNKAIIVAIIALVVALATNLTTLKVTWDHVHVTHMDIQRNTQTAEALCQAAGGARDFWIKVRNSTEEFLKDPAMTPTARKSNLEYLAALNDVIRSANDLAHSCPKGGS